MPPEELKQRVDQIDWFHTIDLGGGIVTPGKDDTPAKLQTLGLPTDLTGKTVLDIGAWDGFFSLTCAQRGAAVLATDHFCWSGEGWGTKAGFELAREVLGLPVRDQEIDAMDISEAEVGTHDIVLFLGVLYHLRHPLLALEKVAEVTRECLILETEVDLVDFKRPAAAFYADTDLNNDPTNWWAPNAAALSGMLKAVGFSRIEVIRKPRPLPLRLARAMKQQLTQGKSFFREYTRDRMVVHAYK
ncbi:MAG: tRNA (mo5U34)-methyltransferase [Kiritimatiellia bacterium]|jgi:tRNA (mo5U34)-methyltransferase